MDIELHDLITIGILVLLEGLLSGDNALVLAVLVSRLPAKEQRKALQYGIIGAFVLRIIAVLLARFLIQMHWTKLLGGAYLLFIAIKHFIERRRNEEHATEVVPRRFLGLSPFWSVVLAVEMTDLVFAVDSILVAVAMSPKVWVVITGGLLGLLMMRLLTMQVVGLVERYPKLIDGAYLIILWIGFKLFYEYLHLTFPEQLPVAINKWVSLGIVIALFIASFLYARMDRHDEKIETAASDAEDLLEGHTVEDHHGEEPPETRPEVTVSPQPERATPP